MAAVITSRRRPSRAQAAVVRDGTAEADKAWAALEVARVEEASALREASAAQERARNASETVALAWKTWNGVRLGPRAGRM